MSFRCPDILYLQNNRLSVSLILFAKSEIWSSPGQKISSGTHETGILSRQVAFRSPIVLLYMSCHRDGGTSQGDTRHSMPPARRQGGFNFDYQLFPPLRGDGGARAIMA